MRLGVVAASAILSFSLGCDGYLATKGQLLSATGHELSGCSARIESESGTVVRDWFAIESDFGFSEVVAPGRDTYFILISCPGHYPLLQRVRSGRDSADLGQLRLVPIDGNRAR